MSYKKTHILKKKPDVANSTSAWLHRYMSNELRMSPHKHIHTHADFFTIHFYSQQQKVQKFSTITSRWHDCCMLHEKCICIHADIPVFKIKKMQLYPPKKKEIARSMATSLHVTRTTFMYALRYPNTWGKKNPTHSHTQDILREIAKKHVHMVSSVFVLRQSFYK